METLFIGKNFIFLPEVKSTNSYAIDLLKNVNLVEGTVIHTAHQTEGKGQRDSVWNSEAASNLTASFVLKPGFLQLNKQFYLYMIAALACYDTTAEFIDSSQFDIKIKWPNDILVNQKKVAGILIENKLTNNVISHCVIGVGININQINFSDPRAASVRLFTGKENVVEQVLERLCYNFEHYYLLLKNNKLDEIRKKYLQHLYGLGESLNFMVGNSVGQYKVCGIGETGLLTLQSTDGSKMEVDVKQVVWQY